MGYINFGISDEINQQMNMCHGKKGTVLVVGAGCAGKKFRLSCNLGL